MKRFLVPLIVVLMVPGVMASLDAEQDVRHYELERFAMTQENPPPGEIVNFTFDNTPRHGYPVIDSEYTVRISHTVQYEASSDGIWNVSAQLNGVNVTGCDWRISTDDPGGFLGEDFSPSIYFQVFCDARMFLADGNNTFSLVRFVQSGTPDPLTATTVSVIVKREDLIDVTTPTPFEELFGLEGLEFLFALAVFFGVLWFWARSELAGLKWVMVLFIFMEAVWFVSLFVASLLAFQLLMAVVFMGVGIYAAVKTFIFMTTKAGAEI